MTKIWTESSDPEQLTEAKNHTLNAADCEPGAYLGILTGQPLAGRFPKTSIEITSEQIPNDYFDVGGLFVVSGGVKSVMDEFIVNAEFFPLDIIFHGLVYTKTKFFFCNI